jgi:hypothetical protein
MPVWGIRMSATTLGMGGRSGTLFEIQILDFSIRLEDDDSIDRVPQSEASEASSSKQ